MEIRALSDTLRFEADSGLWSVERSARVAYPEDGNAECFELEDTSFWFRHRNRCIVSAVANFPPGGPILDVGGGNGYVARGLIDAGFDTALLEPGRTGAFNARSKRGIKDVICATVEACNFQPDSVAAVGLFDVLEHIEDDDVFLDRLRRVLRSGGLLYLTVPAHQSLWSASDVDAHHFRRYSLPALGARLAPVFDLLYATYFFQVLLVPIAVARVLPYRLGLARRGASGYAAEHGGAKSGLLARAIASRLEGEHRTIVARGRLATGTSCLAVARRR